MNVSKDFAFDSKTVLAGQESIVWIDVDEVLEQTGVELVVDGDVPEARAPSDEELRWIREAIDPEGFAKNEVPG